MSLRGWFLPVVALLLILASPSLAGEIHDAIAGGDLARVAELLRGDPSLVNSQTEDPMHNYPLHTAAINNQVDIARLLLKVGAEVDCGDRDGSTPLHDAALLRKQEMVDFLLSKGADVNKRDQNGAFALTFAATGGDSVIVRRMLDAGADVDVRYRIQGNGATMMHAACSRGLFWFADMLLAKGADINAQNGRGETPLNWTCQNRFPDRVEQTLARGANPALADTFGRTPLHMAALNWGQQPENVRILLDRGVEANVPDRQGTYPIHFAAMRGDAGITRMLLDHGSKVQVVNKQGETPLLEAVDGGYAEAAELLLKAGAATDNKAETFGWSALHKAAAFGYRDLAEALVKHKANVNLKDDNGRTPLDLAVQHGYTELASYLKAHGAKGAHQSRPPSLTDVQNLSAGQAEIWYLAHSAWAIKTPHHLLIFDYGDMGRRSDEPNLNGGDINPEEITGEQVTVFASHGHGDHYLPAMFEWRSQVPRIHYVLGFQPENLEGDPPYEYIEPHQTRMIDGMKVTTLESDDAGVGFLVEVDGLSIFHPGDHANMQEDMSGPFKGEIDALVTKGAHPDIAFSPLIGCGGGTQLSARLGAEYVLETMQPKVMFPMHGGKYGTRYVDFIGAIQKDTDTRTTLLAPLCKGDHFSYRNGEAS